MAQRISSSVKKLMPHVRHLMSRHGRNVDAIVDSLFAERRISDRTQRDAVRISVREAISELSKKPSRRSDAAEERLRELESNYKRKRDQEAEDESEDSVDAAINMGDIAVEQVTDSNILNESLLATYRAHATPGSSNGAKSPAPASATTQPSPAPRTPQPAASTSSAAPSPIVPPSDRKKTTDKAEKPSSEARAERTEKSARIVRRSSSGSSKASSESGFTSIERPTLRYCDMGGIEHVLQDVRELIEGPLLHPEIFTTLGIEPPRGILFHGPPGCGKTALASAIAGEVGVPFLRISAPEIVSGMSGESEAKIRDLFAEAASKAPAIIFIDEIDAIAPKRDAVSREMERRIVTQLLTCMDDVSMEKTKSQCVMVLAATNRPDALDTALRRAGRFDREISLGIPDEPARVRILEVMCKKMKLAGDFDMRAIAKLTPGFVGADLQAVAKEAAVLAVRRILSEVFPPAAGAAAGEMSDRRAVSDALRTSGPLSAEMLAKLAIDMNDFSAAIKKVQPSAKREGFATVPDVSWADIGALQDIREELCYAIVEPIKHPERFLQLGISSASGVLLYGPPGCGKTLLAKAVAKEAGANFISVKGPELLNKYVGETEKAIRQVFMRGKSTHPTIIFFDEFDALAPRRGSGGEANQATERVVNQLLTEMDGLDQRGAVFVIAATNRPDIIDPAVMRPGRLGKKLYVPLPTPAERTQILRTIVRSTKSPVDPSLDMEMLGSDPRMEGFSGADLSALLREASVACYRETYGHLESNSAAVPTSPVIAARHFSAAFERVLPSVSRQAGKSYEVVHKTMQTSHVADAKRTVSGGEVNGPSATPGAPR